MIMGRALKIISCLSQAYFYYRSPYTNLCSCDENQKECNMPGTQFTNVKLLNGTTDFTVETSDEPFYFCNQDEIGFPPIPAEVQDSNKWMTDSQEQLARVYGVTCFALLILYGVVILGKTAIRTVLSLVTGVYKVCSCFFPLGLIFL